MNKIKNNVSKQYIIKKLEEKVVTRKIIIKN